MYNDCAYGMAHLKPSSDYGYTYVQAKCTDSDSVVLLLVCWTTRPDTAVTQTSPSAGLSPTPSGSTAPPVAAFSSPTTPPASDAAAVASLAEDVGQAPAGVTSHAGRPLAREARDLIRNIGTAHDTLAAFPTTSGEVCFEVEGDGGCGFLDGRAAYGSGIAFGILWDRASGATRVFGVAANQVKAVDVEIGGIEYPATLSNNGFYYQLPDGISDNQIQQVVATWADGSVHQFPVHP